MILIYNGQQWHPPGPSATVEITEAEAAFIRSYYNCGGNAVTAIKALRERYSLGLKEAKDLWDSIKLQQS